MLLLKTIIFLQNKHKVDFTGQGRVDWLAGIR